MYSVETKLLSRQSLTLVLGALLRTHTRAKCGPSAHTDVDVNWCSGIKPIKWAIVLGRSGTATRR
jgi:hypothetical protein